ncbi:hypothetical protein FYK55_21150 [Roseiconus nitratireducens]|uniref:Uncharacterized protein n=1 Tax=Roseiconus nitratireducens TaxID=2605748 RepID=A0A5M6CZ58_9BACT|nr:hypothetical protein [Roseiconus nitratireducens]KAA5540514.1 hypothetical protein FYK55_21150 [Roseiconus nitratireducens]
MSPSQHAPTDTSALIAFSKRFAPLPGACLALIVVLGLVGLAWEPAAIAATVLGIVATIALVFAGRIGIVIAAWRDKTAQGLLSLFVPIYAYYYAFTRKGAALNSVVVLVSALIPALATMLVLQMTYSLYSPAGRSAARQQASQQRADRMRDMILQRESDFADDAELVTATYRIAGNVSRAPNADTVEQLLSEFKSYVPKSVTLDPVARSLSFQYRGPDNLQSQYGLYLASRTGIVLLPAGP